MSHSSPPDESHDMPFQDGEDETTGADERLFFAELRSEKPPKPTKGASTVTIAANSQMHGHRDRLRDRFKLSGESAFADYELLELLLFRLIPRKDTKSIAKALLQRFGSVGGVLGAPSKLLQEVSGIGETVAFEIKVIAAVSQRALKSDLNNRTLLSSWSSVIDYCHAAMAHESREQFRVLFLDKKNMLIADEIQGVGTVDHTPVYPREVVKRALELSSTAIILVHNHPSGDPAPSRADIEMTRLIVDIAKPMGIVVHDHIIIGKSGHASFKGLKLI